MKGWFNTTNTPKRHFFCVHQSHTLGPIHWQKFTMWKWYISDIYGQYFRFSCRYRSPYQFNMSAIKNWIKLYPHLAHRFPSRWNSSKVMRGGESCIGRGRCRGRFDIHVNVSASRWGGMRRTRGVGTSLDFRFQRGSNVQRPSKMTIQEVTI